MRHTLCATLLAGLAACAEPAGSPTAPVDPALDLGIRSLQFVHRAPEAPPFKDGVATLEARAGSGGQAVLTFADGTPFARLTLAPGSLDGATLDGRPLGPGETVSISLRRPDASRYLVDLQPSGLVFNPGAPAVLEFFYAYASMPAAPVGVFKQHRNGEQWFRTESGDDTGLRVMRSRVDDFTIYAMSGG